MGKNFFFLKKIYLMSKYKKKKNIRKIEEKKRICLFGLCDALFADCCFSDF